MGPTGDRVLFWQSLAECAAGVLFPVSRGSKNKKTDDDDDDDDSTTKNKIKKKEKKIAHFLSFSPLLRRAFR